MSNGCFHSDLFVGPNFYIGDNFYIAPAVSLGIRCSRDTLVYESTLSKDLFTQSAPKPKFAIGGKIRVGYDFGRFAVFGGVGYDRLFSYGRSDMLADPWVLVSEKSGNNVISAEIGASYVITDDNFVSGDNCLQAGVSAGYGTMGAFVSADVTSFKRIGYYVGHSYGGQATFYVQSGNAEVGGQYNLEFFPCGSDSWYSMSIGTNAVMGLYQRAWKGIALEDPERFQILHKPYSFGGGSDVELSPVGGQFGCFNLSLSAGIGLRAVLQTEAKGNLGYQVQSDNIWLNWYTRINMTISL
jgi:hypothetical protein